MEIVRKMPGVSLGNVLRFLRQVAVSEDDGQMVYDSKELKVKAVNSFLGIKCMYFGSETGFAVPQLKIIEETRPIICECYFSSQSGELSIGL